MKIVLGQINTTPGDFHGNTQQILDGIKEAGTHDAQMIVFPELAICGYLVKDMLYQKGFINRNLIRLNEIARYAAQYPKLTVVVGYADRNTKGQGKPFTNMAAVIQNGIVVATYQKQLLPYYDVFDEGRYFEPGNTPCVIEVAGHKWGIVICEDLWNDKGMDNHPYPQNPLKQYRDLEVSGLISLNASPYAYGKPESRLNMLRKIKNSELNEIRLLVYVNCQGGQDELVFDGNSAFLVGNRTLGLSSAWPRPDVPRYVHCESYTQAVDLLISETKPVAVPKVTELFEAICVGLQDYVRKTSFQKVVLGSSGGIDSALVAALATAALGAENVHCIMMPSQYSSEGSIADAKKLHANLGCREYTVPIEWPLSKLHPHINQLLELDPAKYHAVADENIQARLRGLILMHFSNATGALLLTTGNKTELALGYTTLYGDSNGGFNPIGDLYKNKVYELARYINQVYDRELIPNAIIDKKPSAELAPNQTDEDSLLPYEVLNPLVEAYLEHHVDDYHEFCLWAKQRGSGAGDMKNKLQSGAYYGMIRRIDMMEFKRKQAAPIIKVTNRAFGTGRRFPIVSNQTLRNDSN